MNFQKISMGILDKKKNIYFIGIGGISMSAIAVILRKNGHSISGSDMTRNSEVEKLLSLGIDINIGHDGKNIVDGIDIVVYSKAIHDDNPEMIEAKKKNILLMSRSEMLGEIMTWFKSCICVAGTHGKTTTTSCISKVLMDLHYDPTINIGGVVPEIGGNVHIGEGKDIFVAEACEYTNSFLDFHPSTAVVTNIEEDHLDFFKDIHDIRNSFKKFIDLLPPGGVLVINSDIENVEELYDASKIKVITYGMKKDSDFYYENLHYDEDNFMMYDVYKKGKLYFTMKQRLIGEHNALNTLAAIAVIDSFGIDMEKVKTSLLDFTGAKRRLELKPDIDGIHFLDDYAHHPAEIEASIKAIKNLKYKNLYIIYQPHTYTRTKALLSGFIKALNGDFNLILAKIYAAREIDDDSISSKDIQAGILANKNNSGNICEYSETFENICECVSKNARPGDLVVSMGAGDIEKFYETYKNYIHNK